MSDLFEASGLGENLAKPLAERVRPANLAEVCGQDHLLGEGGAIARMVNEKRLQPLILWGPPGTGKTSIARLLADAVGLEFVQISAIFSGVAELRQVFDAARSQRAVGRQTLLFVDEIHRFNKAQQDSFLPHVEDGTIVLVGATTENPSFELNAALLSRMQVMVLHRHDDEALEALIHRAEAYMEKPLPLTKEARTQLKAMADGDGRYMLNCIETLYSLAGGDTMDPAAMGQILSTRAAQYDKGGEQHYNLISVLHKALRGSDVQAGLYWTARMLAGGEDPNYILRRLIRFASEDIGLADPAALPQCIAAHQAYNILGSPEGELAVAQAVIYLATAPKSNAAYKASGRAMKLAQESGSIAPPQHSLNAPTKLMKELGYGAGYQYDHDAPEGFSGQSFWPEELDAQALYQPVERGFEREIAKRLAYWERLRGERAKVPEGDG